MHQESTEFRHFVCDLTVYRKSFKVAVGVIHGDDTFRQSFLNILLTLEFNVGRLSSDTEIGGIVGEIIAAERVYFIINAVYGNIHFRQSYSKIHYHTVPFITLLAILRSFRIKPRTTKRTL